jgi:hypothetical protein
MKSIKIVKVEIVPGYQLKKYWSSPMQKIFVENMEGFYIDTLDKINWELYVNQEIEGFDIKVSSGYNWLQVRGGGIKIVNKFSNQTEISSVLGNNTYAVQLGQDGAQKSNNFGAVKAFFSNYLSF